MTWGGEEGDPGCEDFTLTPTFGLLPPGGQTSIKIGFHARASKEFNRKFSIDVFDSADQEAQALLRGRISDSPRGTYELKLISFMVWLFANRSTFGEYVNSTLLERIYEAATIDKAQRTVAGRPSKER